LADGTHAPGGGVESRALDAGGAEGKDAEPLEAVARGRLD
jgi:hypothetical protein